MDTDITANQPPLTERGGQLVYIINWFLLVVSICAIVARLLAKWSLRKPFGMDDVMALASLLLSIASATTIAVQVSNGLGTTVDGPRLAALLKSIYAFEILFIAVVCSAKLSIASLLLVLSPVPSHRNLILGTAAIITVWWFVSEFAVAFQCHLPEPWNYIRTSCIDKIGLWYFISAFSIVTDLMLVCIPFVIVRSLQMNKKKKLLVLASFGARLLDVAATAAQIAYTPLLNLSDTSHGLWPWILILQVVQCTSIVTSCLPYLRQLVEIIPSGMYTSDEIRRRVSIGFRAGRSSGSRLQGSSSGGRSLGRAAKARIIQLSNLSRTTGEYTATITTAPRPDNASDQSNSRIIKTTTFGITSQTA